MKYPFPGKMEIKATRLKSGKKAENFSGNYRKKGVRRRREKWGRTPSPSGLRVIGRSTSAMIEMPTDIPDESGQQDDTDHGIKAVKIDSQGIPMFTQLHA